MQDGIATRSDAFYAGGGPVWRHALMLAAVVFLLSLAGITTRPMGQLAAFWPANAVILGLMIRVPAFNKALCWLGIAAGLVLADLLMGSALHKTVLLTGANMVGIAVGTALYRRVPLDDRVMRRPVSVVVLIAICTAASSAVGIVGAAINPVLFQGSATDGWLFWTATELVNYMAILPVILTCPPISRWQLDRRRQWRGNLRPMDMIPAAAFVAICLLAAVVGGPGAPVFPIPALLWCAIVYSPFVTALLTLAFSAWTLMAIANGILPVVINDPSLHALLSLRLGVALIALTPIAVGCVMTARNRLVTELEMLASQDQLTGLFNRRAFRERADLALQTAMIAGKPAAALMMDLDHFKSVNDTYGHAAGDAVLVAFALRARECLRGGDVIGRWGGEEFAVLLPDCSPADAAVIAERLRAAMADGIIRLGDGQALTVTVSIGIASIQGVVTSLDGALSVADMALYDAKAIGRNRAEMREVENIAAQSPGDLGVAEHTGLQSGNKNRVGGA